MDEALESIGDRGIVSGQVAAVGDGGRKAVFNDVDGNAVSFIEVNTRA